MRILALMLVLAASPAAAQTAPAQINDVFGTWSPDGKRISFTSDRTGDPEIYVANADGGGLRQLTHSPGRDAHSSWSPDGRTLVFQSPREGGHIRIFRMEADGGNQRALAETTGFCGVPHFSPDGGHIAFQCSPSNTRFGQADTPWRLYLMRADGSELRAITTGPGNDQVPGWSPDGKRLIFFSDRSGGNQIHELTLASGAVRQVTSGPDFHLSASYAADGRIALIKAPPGATGDVHVLGTDGGFRRITRIGIQFGAAMFSPDGTQLLIQVPTEAGVRLHTVPADGSAAPKPIDFRP